MSVIQLSGLTFSYDGSGENVFDNVDLTLDSDWRLGLVGRNGRGKTTLLRILSGELKAAGSITAAVRFEYFPPASGPEDRPCLAVMRSLSDAEDWQLERECGLIGLEEDRLEMPFSLLSPGERTKALLAALFLREGAFPLIDEPTNHLDAPSRGRLGRYLRRKRGFILVSHDRALLDSCTDHTLSINRAGIELIRGSYSVWQREKDRRDAFEAAENERLKKDIARLGEAARRAAEFSHRAEKEKLAGKNSSGLHPDRGFLGHKSAKLMQRSKSIERRNLALAEEKSALLRNVDEAGSLKLAPLPWRGGRMAALRGVTIDYGRGPVCPPVSLELRAGERICLRGRNGRGKSSVLRLLCGGGVPHSGEVYLAPGLVLSAVSQTGEEARGTCADFAAARGIDLPLYFAVLDKLGLPKNQFSMDMSGFSAGQKKKALLAASLCTPAHLYVWDEPLNYIDIISRRQLEELILRFQPTMLFVEHDAAFCAAVATGFVDM